jgi:hypothetical protein
MAVRIIEESRVIESVASYICDSCHKEFDNDLDIQEFLHFRNHAGWGSVFGDGAVLSLDLCQDCVKKILGSFIQFKEEG